MTNWNRVVVCYWSIASWSSFLNFSVAALSCRLRLQTLFLVRAPQARRPPVPGCHLTSARTPRHPDLSLVPPSSPSPRPSTPWLPRPWFPNRAPPSSPFSNLIHSLGRLRSSLQTRSCRRPTETPACRFKPAEILTHRFLACPVVPSNPQPGPLIGTKDLLQIERELLQNIRSPARRSVQRRSARISPPSSLRTLPPKLTLDLLPELLRYPAVSTLSIGRRAQKIQTGDGEWIKKGRSPHE